MLYLLNFRFSSKELKNCLNIISTIIIALTFLAVIWIIVPAPSYYIWLFSVAVGEWSLWFGAAALIGILGVLIAHFYYESKNVWLISFIIGIIALAVSIYPFLSSVSVANEKNISLSPKEYFSGLWNENSAGKGEDFTTYTFIQHGETQSKLDVYLPTDNALNSGASVIVVHGGSWNGGKRNDFPQWNIWLANEGFTVFDIDYTLAPQPNWQTATGDVKCAIVWIKQHAAEFKIAPEKITLLGRSAGAHLALLAAYSAGDARLPANCGETGTDESVRAVVSFYAPTALLWDYDNPANRFVINGPQTLADFLGGNPHESEEIRSHFIVATPITYISPKTPPTLLIHGGQDQLVKSENMNLLADQLTQERVLHETLLIPYAQHGFDYNFNGWGAQISKSVILKFLRENTGENH